MPFRRGSVEPANEGGIAWYRVHANDEERAAANSAIDDLYKEVIARAGEMADARGVQLAELLGETANRLQEEVVELLMKEPIWSPTDE